MNFLKSVLQEDSYTIYQMRKENLCAQPWQDSCSLLTYQYSEVCLLNSAEQEVLNSYLINCDGKILFYSELRSEEESFSSFFEKLNIDLVKIKG